MKFNRLRETQSRDSDPHHSTPLTARTSSDVPTSSMHTTSASEDAVDRRLSVRSVITLPPYRIAPLPSERLIAREGEREGVDTVVEFPETDEQAEGRREEEMGALYNIREARRQEQAGREDRRRERREARDRGDWARVQQLEAESRARARERSESNASNLSATNLATSASSSLTNVNTSANQDSAYLIAELQSLRESNRRNRRVSSVSYAELGVAAHDGSRIRADSMESDHRPLLDSAASMGGRRSRATSTASTRDPSTNRHVRNTSDGDVSFISTGGEEDRNALLTPQSSGDVPPDPPSYEDDLSVHGGEVPAYSSPVATRAPQLPETSRSPLRDEPSTSAQSSPTDQRQSEEEIRGRQGRPSIPTDSNVVGSPLEPTTSTSTLRLTPSLTIRPPSERIESLRHGHAPQIEVMSATPVSSGPGSPVEWGRGR